MAIEVVSQTDSKEAEKTETPVVAPEETVKDTSAPGETPEPKEDDSESGTEQTEEKEETTDEDGEESEDETESEEGEESEPEKTPEAQEKPKRKNGFKKRIDKLNSRLAQERQQREQLERRLAELEANKEKPATEKKTEASDKPRAEDFETQADWIEALTDWKADQRDKKNSETQRQNAMKTEHEKVVDTYAQRAAKFAKTTPDYFEVIQEADVKLSVAVEHLLLSSENGPAIAYRLAQDPDELERLNRLAPLAAAKAIGALEAKIQTQTSEQPKSEPKKTTKAPKPIAPVVGSKSAAIKSIFDADLSQAEYERLRREQIKQREA